MGRYVQPPAMEGQFHENRNTALAREAKSRLEDNVDENTVHLPQ